MSRTIFTILLLIASCSSVAAWSPPSTLDPEAIYESMYEDFRHQNYEDALAKHLWFHNHVLEYRKSYYGVRLSYALSQWVSLSSEYPPAKEALESTRIKAREDARKADLCCINAFHDFSSINRVLGMRNETVILFEWINNNRPDYAKKVYRVAKPALVEESRHELLLKFTNPDREIQNLESEYRRYHSMVEMLGNSPEFVNDMNQSFIHGVTVLVSLLVISGDETKALEISKRAKETYASPEFEIELEKAMQGKMPRAWP